MTMVPAQSLRPVHAGPDLYFTDDDNAALDRILPRLGPLAADLYRTYRSLADDGRLEQPSTRRMIRELAGGDTRKFYHAEQELTQVRLIEVQKGAKEGRIRVHSGAFAGAVGLQTDAYQLQTDAYQLQTDANIFGAARSKKDSSLFAAPNSVATTQAVAVAEPEASWRDRGEEPERILDPVEEPRPANEAKPAAGNGSLADRVHAAAPSSDRVAATPRAQKLQKQEQRARRLGNGETKLMYDWYCHFFVDEYGLPCPDPERIAKRALITLRQQYSLPQVMAFIDCYWGVINVDAYPSLRLGRSVLRLRGCLPKMCADHGIWLAERAAVWAERLGRIEDAAGE